MKKVKKVFFKKNFVVVTVVLLAMLFPGVVFSSVLTTQNPLSLEGELIFVAESCEDFKRGDCIIFEDFKGQTMAYLTNSFELTKTLILTAETDIAKRKKDIAAIVNSYWLIETAEFQNYLKRRLLAEEDLLIQDQQNLFLLEEMSISYEELLNSFQTEVTEPKHIPIWKKKVIPLRVEKLSKIVEQFNNT